MQAHETFVGTQTLWCASCADRQTVKSYTFQKIFRGVFIHEVKRRPKWSSISASPASWYSETRKDPRVMVCHVVGKWIWLTALQPVGATGFDGELISERYVLGIAITRVRSAHCLERSLANRQHMHSRIHNAERRNLPVSVRYRCQACLYCRTRSHAS